MSTDARYVRVLCPRDCGQILAITEPPLTRRKLVHPNPVTRWIRRRTVRVMGVVHDYRYGKAIKDALLYHYLVQCSKGLMADEDCGADCPYCTESTYRCDREKGHDGDHEEHDESDRLLHNWRNEESVPPVDARKAMRIRQMAQGGFWEGLE